MSDPLNIQGFALMEYMWHQACVACNICCILKSSLCARLIPPPCVWVNHACIFALPSASFTLVQLARSNWVSGSVPLRRGRDNRNPAPTHSWDDCVGARCAVLGFELVLPGIMRPLSYPPTLRAVLWHTRLWVQWWHWWLIYILRKLSIFHIILFESIML